VKAVGTLEEGNERQKEGRKEGRLCAASITPSVLEPDFDLLGFNVGKDRAVLDELLASDRAGLGALMVHTLQSLHLLICVANIFSRCIHSEESLHTRSSHSLA
jgi:hypothetical protein